MTSEGIVALFNASDDTIDMIQRLLTRADAGQTLIWCHFADLKKGFPKAAKALASNGGLWVAWPKKASGVATDVDEHKVRATALAAGLVDNKVCAIDETWSGLRCVIRLKDRPKKG